MLYINPLATPLALRGAGDSSSPAREKLALQELEHFFALQIVREMRKSVPRDALLDGGQAQSLFEDMLDDAISAEWAKSGQLGVAAQVEAQLRAAEAQQGVANAEVMNGA